MLPLIPILEPETTAETIGREQASRPCGDADTHEHPIAPAPLSLERALLARMFLGDLEIATHMVSIADYTMAESALRNALNKIQQLRAL